MICGVSKSKFSSLGGFEKNRRLIQSIKLWHRIPTYTVCATDLFSACLFLFAKRSEIQISLVYIDFVVSTQPLRISKAMQHPKNTLKTLEMTNYITTHIFFHCGCDIFLTCITQNLFLGTRLPFTVYYICTILSHPVSSINPTTSRQKGALPPPVKFVFFAPR